MSPLSFTEFTRTDMSFSSESFSYPALRRRRAQFAKRLSLCTCLAVFGADGNLHLKLSLRSCMWLSLLLRCMGALFSGRCIERSTSISKRRFWSRKSPLGSKWFVWSLNISLRIWLHLRYDMLAVLLSWNCYSYLSETIASEMVQLVKYKTSEKAK